MAEAGQLPPSFFPIELHCHSTASDGTYPPAQVVALAAARGVRVLALTDHDTTRVLSRPQPQRHRTA